MVARSKEGWDVVLLVLLLSLASILLFVSLLHGARSVSQLPSRLYRRGSERKPGLQRQGGEIKPSTNEISAGREKVRKKERLKERETVSRGRDKPRRVSVRDESLSVGFRVGNADSACGKDTNSTPLTCVDTAGNSPRFSSLADFALSSPPFFPRLSLSMFFVVSSR